MTTATATPTLDISGTRPIPFMRLLKVELRKMADTRAGRWLLIAGAGFGVVVTLGFFIFGKAQDRQFIDLLQYFGIPFAFLLPVLGILTVTQEWGQRTALVTFAHEPHRSRVLLAKFLTALLYGLAAIVIATVVSAALTPLGGADKPWAEFNVSHFLRIVLGLEIGVVFGFAFGMALLSSAFAIVLHFLVPVVINIIGGIWQNTKDTLAEKDAVMDHMSWIDLNTASGKLFDAADPTGKEWAQILVAALIWVGIPAAIGVWRVLRSEVK